jgi:hypothetical protein
VLVCAVLVEAVALRAHTLGIVVLGALAGLALVVVVARADLARIGMGAALLSAFTISWNGWYVGGIRPGDALVPIALICFAAGAPITVFRAPPWWVKQLVLALVLGVLLIVLLPPEPFYLAHRVVMNAGGQPITDRTTNLGISNLGIAAKFVIAVGAIPVAFTAAALLNRRAIRWLAIAFVTGTSLSGLVAFVDRTLHTKLSTLITRLPVSVSASGRAGGFTNHPNFLAAGLVLAIPFAAWLLTARSRWQQWVGAVCLLADLLGVYATGSRGGAVCAVGAVVLAFVLLPRTRPHLPAIILAGIIGVGIIVVAFPSFGLAVLRVTRLSGNVTTAGSDIVRAENGAQGWADFRHSPIHGIGLQVSTEASQVYIQELAAGGLVLFLAMSAYMLGAAWDSLKLIPHDSLAAAILGSIGATLALNLFEADLTDRFYYVPEAILVAMLITRRVHGADPPATPEPVLAEAAR